MANEVLKSSTSITLSWNAISGANKYHLQVSQVPDFSDSLIQDDNTLVSPTKAFTDTGVINSKRYFRWQYSTDGGTTWSIWQEVGSFWVNTGAANDVSLSNAQWAIFNPTPVTDIFVLTTNPIYKIVPQLVPRLKERNRQGTLLSEFITTKVAMTLDYPATAWMDRDQFNTMIRMNREVKTFFVACNKYNGQDYVPHIWLAQFSSDPALTMIAAGRQDIYVGSLALEEV